MKDFKVIKCDSDKIIVNREPQNKEEETMMRLAIQDNLIRSILLSSGQIQYKEE